MLSLKRKVGERIIATLPTGEQITVEVARIDGAFVSLRIDAPSNVRVNREEIEERRNADLFRGQQGDSASKL